MRIPKELDNAEAKDFWKRNSPLLEADGRLTDHTRDGFLLLCQVWGTYFRCAEEGVDAIRLVALQKQIQQLMDKYGMTPAARRRMKLDEKKTDLGEIMNTVLGIPSKN